MKWEIGTIGDGPGGIDFTEFDGTEIVVRAVNDKGERMLIRLDVPTQGVTVYSRDPSKTDYDTTMDTSLLVLPTAGGGLRVVLTPRKRDR